MSHPAGATPGRTPAGEGALRNPTAWAAIVLWVIVLAALAYGVINTGISVLELFGG